MAGTLWAYVMSARCMSIWRSWRLGSRTSNTSRVRGSNSGIVEAVGIVSRTRSSWIMNSEPESSTRSSISTPPTPGGSWFTCIGQSSRNYFLISRRLLSWKSSTGTIPTLRFPSAMILQITL